MRFWAFLLATVSLFAEVRLNYPPAPQGSQVDDFHGTKIADPYRWLEQDSPQTKAWVQAEQKLSDQYLNSLPSRQRIRAVADRMFATIKYPALDFQASVRTAKGRVFYMRQEPGQNQPLLYVRDANGPARVLLDPNTLSKDGTTAVATWQPSPDGKWLAYGLSSAGSDWQKFHVRNVDTLQDLPDLLDWIKFSSASWAPDSSAFYYSRFPKPQQSNAYTAANTDSKLYLHRLRTAQSEDKLIYERPDQKEWMFSADPTPDGRYLVISVSWGTRQENLVFYRDLKQDPNKTIELFSKFEASYSFLGNRGSTFYFSTTDSAPRGRVIAIDVNNPQRSAWKEAAPQRQATLEQSLMVENLLVLNYLRDAASALYVRNLDTNKESEVKLPGLGTVLLPSHLQTTPLYYSFTSFTTPEMLYRYDTVTGTAASLEKPTPVLNPTTYEEKQVFYNSNDGTRVPMFLVYRKGTQLNGGNPTLLYGYGGFKVSITPSFSPLMGAWLELGGVLAVANLRGGGEYGEDWYKAGRLDHKQNVFDDFISAAEWLIANKYTSSKRLAIHGRSNGGLLVGATLNQRPDLFGAAVPGVGVMDMLRFHKFTIGSAWMSDYGSPDKAEDFKYLRAYSPLHNVRKVAYPPTLIMTSDHDDRVVPAHSFKYAAAMQHAQQGPAPIIVRIETAAGHGAGKPVSKRAEENTDLIAFVMNALDFVPQQ